MNRINQLGKSFWQGSLNFFSKIFSSLLIGRRINRLKDETEQIKRESDIIKKSILEITRQLEALQKGLIQTKKQPNPYNTITDLHGNPIHVHDKTKGTGIGRDVMAIKSRASSSFNVRRCKVWGCKGMNEKEGYCKIHYQRHRKE